MQALKDLYKDNLFAHHKISIILLDQNKKIQWWNKFSEKLFKLQLDIDISEIFPNLDLFRDFLQRQSTTVIHLESKKYLSLSAIPYINKQIILIIQDVTHILHLERMRQDFVANVSHELRTPLTVIHGYLECLLDINHSKQIISKRILKKMYQQTIRMEKLIENLLLLANLENNKVSEEHFKFVDVPLLLHQICQDAKTLSKKQKHRIELQIDKKLKIYGLTNALQSAFTNILINAIKYTPKEGLIKIRWYRDEDFAYLSISDTGIGFAEEHLSRITERFYRVDDARSRDSGGTGLGLAIVKHALIRHQAELKIESKPTLGSTFSCIFPSKLIVTNN